MTLVIMAAGMGSRYGGLKQIDPITEHGEFIIDFSIYDALQAGFDKVVFIIKEENYEAFHDTVGKRIEGKIKVGYAFQKLTDLPAPYSVPEGRVKPWGTAQAVLSAKDLVKEPFAVINADDFYGRDAFVTLASFLKDKKESRGHYAMAGYVLENTITENGHVSRGICETKDNKLVRVVERTKIMENNGVIQYEEDGIWHDLDRKDTVSMNCWAFTPDLFGYLEKGFESFLEKLPASPNPLKAEFFLPFLVQEKIDAGECDVTMLHTTAKWYGVTYHEDKPRFVNFIREATAAGLYPDGLWK